MPDQLPHLDRRALLRTGLGAATLGVAGATGALVPAASAPAAPAAPRPAATPTPAQTIGEIITCGSWAARPPTSPLTMNTGTTQKIVVHHTAYPNSTDYSVNQAIWLARDIQRLHQDGNGWPDSGQHFTVSRGGYLLEGRHQSLAGLRGGTQQVVGAHSPGENGRGIGIENEGIYVTESPPQRQVDALVDLCVAVCVQYRIGAHRIFGHWDFQLTQCPGAAFYRQFPALRREVARRLGTALTAIPERTWPDILSSSRGETVRVAQHLLRARGYTVTASGTFDPATVAAVEDFQRRNGITPTGLGEIRDSTWDLLVVPVAAGGTGEPVAGLQSILAVRGYPVTATGTLDTATREAVRQLQTRHGLTATGEVDRRTWCAVVGGSVREAFRTTLLRR
ncbi:peptidoglycan recognition protein family protein [Micromonospora fluostatini]|uniref:peptidoglycan recognition protein family protein n=1 Tax=Micromonospora sp. JCM 30529 TaxID=3421643 RepID=UPI003D171AC9